MLLGRPLHAASYPFEDPRGNALDADVFWQPGTSSFVLPLLAQPRQADNPALELNLARLRCRISIFEASDDLQHVLFASSARRLQLALRGGSILGRVRLFADVIVPPELLERRLLLLRRLSDLVAIGDLRDALYTSDPRSRRWRFVLQALDGSLARAPQHEIAQALFEPLRVEANWRDPRDHLRDQVRRAVRRGRWLMQGGYLNLLK